MTATQEQMSERDEIEMLLPWYVTGRLDAADTARVAAYLERHPEVRSQIPLVREELSATVAGNEAIRARLASAETLIAGAASPTERVLSWLSRDHRRRARTLHDADAWSRSLGCGRSGGDHLLASCRARHAADPGRIDLRDRVATGDRSPQPAVAMIAFADDASATRIAAVLDEHHLRIVDGPLPGGFYSVRFADEATAAEQQRRLGAIATPQGYRQGGAAADAKNGMSCHDCSMDFASAPPELRLRRGSRVSRPRWRRRVAIPRWGVGPVAARCAGPPHLAPGHPTARARAPATRRPPSEPQRQGWPAPRRAS